MTRKLTSTVHITDAGGSVRSYPGGTPERVIPAEDVAWITNPAAWEDDNEDRPPLPAKGKW